MVAPSFFRCSLVATLHTFYDLALLDCTPFPQQNHRRSRYFHPRWLLTLTLHSAIALAHLDDDLAAHVDVLILVAVVPALVVVRLLPAATIVVLDHLVEVAVRQAQHKAAATTHTVVIVEDEVLNRVTLKTGDQSRICRVHERTHSKTAASMSATCHTMLSGII